MFSFLFCSRSYLNTVVNADHLRDFVHRMMLFGVGVSQKEWRKKVLLRKYCINLVEVVPKLN